MLNQIANILEILSGVKGYWNKLEKHSQGTEKLDTNIIIVLEIKFQARRHFGTYDVTCLPLLSDNHSCFVVKQKGNCVEVNQI